MLRELYIKDNQIIVYPYLILTKLKHKNILLLKRGLEFD